jgi:ABC-2 type transport system ATP-binding protein
VVILDRGEVIREGSIADLTQSKGTYLVGLADDQKLPSEELRGLGYGVSVAGGGRWEVNLRDGQTIDAAVDMIRQRGLNLRHLEEKRQTLEDLFVQTVEAVEPGLDERRRRLPPRPERDRPRPASRYRDE